LRRAAAVPYLALSSRRGARRLGFQDVCWRVFRPSMNHACRGMGYIAIQGSPDGNAPWIKAQFLFPVYLRVASMGASDYAVGLCQCAVSLILVL